MIDLINMLPLIGALVNTVTGRLGPFMHVLSISEWVPLKYFLPQSKGMHARSIIASEQILGVNPRVKGLSLCVGSAINWQAVQDVTHLLPHDSCSRLQPP